MTPCPPFSLSWRHAAVGLTLAFGTGAALAQSLTQLYAQAREYDAAVQAARAQHQANGYRADQARAGLLPAASLTSSVSRTNLDISITPTRQYSTQSVGASVSQPLYRPANRITWEQGQRQVEQSQAQLQTAEQDLMIRVSQAYFDVLAAQDTLTFVRAQKTAVAEQLAFAKRNFEVGTSTITDSREAQARFDLVRAQELTAENDLKVKRLALDQVSGQVGAQPWPLKQPIELPVPAPENPEIWVQTAEDLHPNIRVARMALDVARLETAKAEAAHRPVIDAVASVSTARNAGGTVNSALTSQSTITTVGINLSVPLFAGYALQNRVRETLALEEKARADLEQARRTIGQSVRTAYLGVMSGQGQVRALEAAEASSQSSLDANRLGYQVGVRINIDVLNAQSQLYQTKRDLAKARYDVLLAGLRLRQVSGELVPEDLARVDANAVKP